MNSKKQGNSKLPSNHSMTSVFKQNVVIKRKKERLEIFIVKGRQRTIGVSDCTSTKIHLDPA